MNKQRPNAIPAIASNALLGAIVLLAVFFRAYRLHEFPPALHWDEAFDGFDALRVLQTASHPFFFDGDNGREPLTIYLQAFGMLAFGTSDWSLRVVSAFLGIATIPVMFRLGVELYRDDARALTIALLAAGLLAVSFWHVSLSRLAMRVISFPLLSGITVWLYWRAWRQRGLRYFALSGAMLGLTLYTYLGARLLPIVLIGFALIAGLLSRYFDYPSIGNWRHLFVRSGALLVGMGLVFAPLGIFFVQHPNAFFVRASQISIFSDNAQGFASLPYNVLAMIRMFIDQGDPDRLRNLPGEPALNALTAFGFWIGTAIAFARLKSRPVYLFLLLWLGINFIASLFSVDIPSSVRAAGLLLPALLIAADGLLSLWEHALPRLSAVGLVMIAIAFGGLLTFNAYFNVWGPSRATYDTLYGPTRTVVEHAITQSRTSDVVLPFSLYRVPSAQFYLANHFSTAQSMPRSYAPRPTTWIATGSIERAVIVLGKDGSVSVPQTLNDLQVARMNELLKKSQPVLSPFGRTVASELSLDNPSPFLSPLSPAYPLDVDFGGQIKLLGYDLDPPMIAPGNVLRITYYWQSLVDQEFNYFAATTLLDAHSVNFGKHLGDPGYETSLWRRGAVIPDSFEFRVPPSAHDGKYRFEVALLASDSPDQALPLSNADDRLLINPFIVARRGIDPNSIPNITGIHLGDPSLMTFLGYDLKRGPMNPGKPLDITLYWKVERQTDVNYSIFLHLLNEDGKVIAQQDGPPQNGNAPTSWWLSGDMFADAHQLMIPPDLRPGRYTLAIGVYDSLRGLRLPIFDASGTSLGDSWKLLVDIENP